MNEYTLPLPLMTRLSRVFWDGCREGKLLYQHCRECGEVIFFPKYLCPRCMGHDLEWLESKGKGVIDTFTVTYGAAPPAFAGFTPYCVAVIRMDEGFRIMSNIVDCDFEEIRCEMPVEVVFEKVTDEVTLHRFRPVKG
jgi:hypothetical protein